MLDRFYFLAVAMKKPRMHVLAQGFQLPSCERDAFGAEVMEVSLLKSCQQPTFMTSYQLFRDLLVLWSSNASSSKARMIESISFVVHTYDVNPFRPLESVYVTGTGDQRQFLCGRARQGSGRAAAKAPFGLSMGGAKKRKRLASNKARPQPGGSKARKSDQVDMPELGSPPASLSSTSNSDRSSSSGSSSDSDAADVQFEEILVQLAEAEEEEKRQVDLLKQHEATREAATAGSKVKAEATSVRRQPTQCNSRLGLVHVGQQVSSKLAKCRLCGGLIQRGDTRFGFAFHIQKFHAWLHPACTLPYMKEQPCFS